MEVQCKITAEALISYKYTSREGGGAILHSRKDAGNICIL
jgi:hypothetical protein